MSDLGRAWGAFGDVPGRQVAGKAPEAAVAPPEAPQAPFTVERMGDGVAVRVADRPLTLFEAQDLTGRLLIVTGPMWAETLPKERI